jgi:outer membrane biosynthesis protein TonB
MATSAYAKDPEPCAGPIYTSKDVSRKARIIVYPVPAEPVDKRSREINGEVVLEVIACSDGSINGIEVVKGLPFGLTEESVKAAQKVVIRPAKKDGQNVSQRIRFQYEFRKESEK